MEMPTLETIWNFVVASYFWGLGITFALEMALTLVVMVVKKWFSEHGWWKALLILAFVSLVGAVLWPLLWLTLAPVLVLVTIAFFWVFLFTD